VIRAEGRTLTKRLHLLGLNPVHANPKNTLQDNRASLCKDSWKREGRHFAGLAWQKLLD